MAGERGPIEITVPASADLSGFQYRVVHLRSDGSAGTFAEPAGALQGTPALGILTNKPSAAGQGARVAIGGVTKMIAGSAVAIGDNVYAPGLAGRGVGQAATTGGTTWLLGVALTRAAASADLFEIDLRPSFLRRD